MNRKPRFYRNLWGLIVLALLRERSMHPYEMQRLIRERHKDDLLDLKAGSLYHAIGRLERAGLIEPVETSREGRRPERTIYRLTEEGQDELAEWLRDLLSRPERDSTGFLAAIAQLPMLSSQEVIRCLDGRAILLEIELAAFDAVVDKVGTAIGRLHVLEVELARALKQAELDWVRELLADLRSGVLNWDTDELIRMYGPSVNEEEVSG